MKLVVEYKSFISCLEASLYLLRAYMIDWNEWSRPNGGYKDQTSWMFYFSHEEQRKNIDIEYPRLCVVSKTAMLYCIGQR